MRYLSVCSGIEAASCAWHPLGWTAVAFAEVAPFPAAVLDHRFPDVPNLGDLNNFASWPESVFIDADVIVGGPPCQAFSAAGLRASLDDPRGNLTLTYMRMIDHADRLRALHGRAPVVVVYENVPGLLSTRDNAFGCFLAGLAGEDDPLVPAGARWTHAGAVHGPERAIAWRILDAQYFGVAQRRRRLFVVASAGAVSPAEILFECDGVRRDTAPDRGEKRDAAAAAADSLVRSGWWDGADISQTLDAVLAKGQCLPEKNRFPAVLCFKASHYTRGKDGAPNDITPPLSADADKGDQDTLLLAPAQSDYLVRRITPLEAERLQGFPDHWTALPRAADTPRYIALGNSMAVPCMRFIGARIDRYLTGVRK